MIRKISNRLLPQGIETLLVEAKHISQLPRPLWGFCPIYWEPDFSRTCGFRRYLKDIMYLHLTPFIAKSNDTIFFNIQKTLFLTPFSPKWGNEIFSEKSGFITFEHIYDPLTSCKTIEKTNETIPRKVHYERTNAQMDRHEFIGPLC